MLAQAVVDEQTCVTCGMILPYSSFYQKAADRLDHTCKECRKKQRRNRYHKHINEQPIIDTFATASVPVQEEIIEPVRQYQNPNDPHPRLPQYTIDEVNRAVKVFEILIRWRNEDRRKGLIDW